MLLGEAATVKLPTELTVREIAVEFVSVSDVPVMTTATVPMAAVPSTVRVRVVESAVGLELNDAETPRQAGRREIHFTAEPVVRSHCNRAGAARASREEQAAG